MSAAGTSTTPSPLSVSPSDGIATASPPSVTVDAHGAEGAALRKMASAPTRPQRRRVVVRVPATSANMGPGFDCLGMAVDIWNEVSVARADTFSLNVSGIDVEHIPSEIHPKTGESKHVLVNALRRAFEYAGESPMPPVSIICRNNIPICSGFGSSSAVIVGGLVAGLVLARHKTRTRRPK